MKNFSKVILGCVFTILIICSVQPIDADHQLAGPSIFKDLTHVNLVDEWDSEYQLYLHVEVRNGQGQLVSISEDSIGRLIPHELTAHTFNEKMGKIEIVTIDNIKYEKVQYVFTPTLEQRTIKYYPIFEEIPIKYELDKNTLALMKELREYYSWKIHYCGTFEGHGYVCIPIFQNFVAVELVTPTDVITNTWTILRALN